MNSELIDIFFCFSFFSIAGWLLEVVYRTLANKRFINPGLLSGPYLPLYGTGAVVLAVSARLIHGSPFILKIIVYLLVTTGLELMSGLTALRLFNKRLWDYSDEPLNYKGIICVKFSIYWILLAFAFEYVVLPFYLSITAKMPPLAKNLFGVIVTLAMSVDFLVTVLKHFFSIEPEDRNRWEAEFNNTAATLLKRPEIARLDDYVHHRGKTRLDHVKEVAWISFILGKRLSLDCKAIIRGALLHDLFFYDWLREGPKLHGFRHHNIAFENAQKITPLTEKEKDIILKHMWPLTIIPPLYPESLLVCFVDTFCSIRDYVWTNNRNAEHKNTASNTEKRLS